MRPIRSALILTSLALAGAAAVMWPDGPVPTAAKEAIPRRVAERTPTPSAFSFSNECSAGESAVEQTVVTAATRRINARLDELNQVLGFTSDQKREVRSLLVRSSGDYDPELPTAGAGALPPRLTRIQAQERIHDLLDPIQQADFEDMLLDDQLWWAEVIERLERDLERATDPADALADPEQSADQEDPPAPAAHRGGNVFDLLNPPEP